MAGLKVQAACGIDSALSVMTEGEITVGLNDAIEQRLKAGWLNGSEVITR